MKYDLTISPQYVSSWGLNEALREIFQNALDQEALGSPMSIDWERQKDGTYSVRIQNKSSLLDKASLLLGNSTKANDDQTIGQFGEGYKLACLVLLRLGKDVRILNYGAKEQWIPRIAHSSKFDSELLQIEVIKYRLMRVPDHDLTWTISGLSFEELKTWRSQNLVTNKNYKFFSLNDIEVLTDEDQKGNVYVRGLFVGHIKNDKMRYGYNLQPSQIKLDRDRKQVQSFDLFWALSSHWARYQDQNLLLEMLIEGSAEVEYLHYYTYEGFSKFVLEEFRRIHGPDAVPVLTQEHVDNLIAAKVKHKPIVVSEALWAYCTSLYTTNLATGERPLTPHEELTSFFSAFEHDMSDVAKTAFQNLLKASLTWKAV